MSLNCSIATCTIVGLSPYSQSRQHDAPRFEGETHDDYAKRTWRDFLSLTDRGTVCIPSHGMHQAIVAAAKYSGKQIPGQGKKTWTAKFTTGIMLMENIDTGIPAEAATRVMISANADGVRGSGKRVTRYYPQLAEWGATFDLYLLDPIITEPVLREMIGIAGMFIGIGRFRPEKGGHNGRFRLERIEWKDNRKLVA